MCRSHMCDVVVRTKWGRQAGREAGREARRVPGSGSLSVDA